MNKRVLKIVSALLAVAVMLPMASCKKTDPNKQSSKRSGTKITENTPWYDSKQYDLNSPLDKDKEIEIIQQLLVGFDDKYIVVSSSGDYVRPADYTGDWNTYDFSFDYISVIDRETKQTIHSIDLLEGISFGTGRGLTVYSDGKIYQRYALNSMDETAFTEKVFDAGTGDLIETRSYDPNERTDDFTIYKLGKYTITANWLYDSNLQQSYYNLNVKSPDGSENTVQLKEEAGSIEQLYFIALKSDTTALIPIRVGIQTKFYELDLKAMTLSYADLAEYEWIDLDRCSDSCLGSDGNIYFTSSTGISKVDFQAKKTEDYFDFNNCNSNIYKLNNLRIADVSGDRILLAGEDNSRYVYGQDKHSTRFEIIELTKVQKNPHAGKTVLELYVADDRTDSRIGDAITGFNETNGSYYIEMTNRYDQSDSERYSASSDDSYFMADININSKLSAQLAADIMSGEGPDILLNASYLGQLNSGRYLADLTPVIGDLDSSKYFTNIVDACKTDGKLYNLPFCFQLRGIQTRPEYAGKSGIGFTTEEYKKFLNETLNGNDIVKYGQPYYFVLLFNAMREKFIANGKADFSGPEFAELAAFVKDNVREKSAAWEDYTSSYMEEPYYATGARYTEIFSPSDYMLTLAELQGGSAFLGIASADGRGPTVSTKFSVAVSAHAQDVNACGEFVKLLMSDEMQTDLASGTNLVLNRDAFRKGAEAALTYINGSGYGNYFEGGGDPNEHRIMFSSKDIDNLEKIILSCSSTDAVDADICIVLIEEMPAYFSGQKDLDSVIRIAQNRAQKVLDERK